MSETVAEAMRGMAEVTTMHRGTQMVENAIKNLVSMRDKPKPSVTEIVSPGSAAIVGAGPSLNETGQQLHDWPGLILTVNTARGAMRKIGATPHAVIAIEQVDVSDQVRDAGCPVYCALSAHPNVFAASTGWFAEASTWQNHIARILGVQPLFTGPCAMSAAFGLAWEWGCRHVVTVGLDLSYDLDSGRYYADGSKWGDLRVSDGGDHIAVSGQETRHAIHDAAGIPRLGDKRSAWEVSGIDGKPRLAPLEFIDQLAWFEARAKWPGRIVNATEHGAHFDGWEHGSLRRECYRAPLSKGLGDVKTIDAGGAIAWMRSQAEGALGHDYAKAPAVFPLVEQLAAPMILRIHECGKEYPPLERIDAIYTCIRDAAKRVLELLDGQA